MINDYWFLIENGKVTGWFSYEFPKEHLEDNQKLLKISTPEPNQYIGLTEEETKVEPLPKPTPDESYKNTQVWRRNELEKLFFQIQFTSELGEDKTQLQNEYDRILSEYNNNKE